MPTPTRTICVIGDVTLDCNIARLPALKTDSAQWNDEDSASVTWERGGAALLTDVIRAVLALSPDAGQSSWTVCGPKTPEEAVINDHVPFPRSYTVWTPHLVAYGEKDPIKAKEQVWRVKQFLGMSRTESTPELDSACPPPDILVINDAHLTKKEHRGFAEQPFPYPEWFTGKHTPRWIVWKTSRLNLASNLWVKFLSKHSDRVIVLCTADGMRQGDAQISKGISWERTVQDLLWDLNFKKFGTHMLAGTSTASCAHVIVSFGAAGTLILNPQADAGKKEDRARLVFDPQAIEKSWEAQRPGSVMGYFSCTAAAVVRGLAENLESPDLVAAAHAGVHACRCLHTGGYGKADDKLPERMAFPRAVVAKAVADRWLTSKDCTDCKSCKADTLACVPVPLVVACSSHEAGDWSILKSKADLAKLAQQIVLDGAEAPLKGVPTARFGQFFETADRREIENYRSVRNLITEFINAKSSKPVSLAVFGPPGSGKSFGVKALAEELAQSMNAPMEIKTFNLSQFQAQTSEDLNNALHQVRDIGLSGKLPLIFWDEFDTDKLSWLRRFLEPMQDGTFLEGQVTHPIGKAIFVFAGGTCNSLASFNKGLEDESFRAAKGPDFVSRLRGYLDILGPNPVGSLRDDPAFIVRRAMLLRSLIERNCPTLLKGKSLHIDEGVLDALLHISQYKHGARSMESLVLSSALAGKLRFDRSSLPQMAQLDVHVNGAEFFARVSKIRNPAFLAVLAKAIHANYYEKLVQREYSYAEQSDDTAKTSSSLKPYDELAEGVKQDNLNAAQEMPDKLALAGYAIVPDRVGDAKDHFPKDEVEIMAEAEHDRWLRGKIAAGWVYGATRDNATKRHSAMLPWRTLTESERARLYPEKPEAVGLTALPDSEKQKDRDQFDGLPSMLKKFGYAVSKLTS
jgi:hypothetical protein